MEERIGSYLQEKIRAADNLIVEHAIAKIQARILLGITDSPRDRIP